MGRSSDRFLRIHHGGQVMNEHSAVPGADSGPIPALDPLTELDRARGTLIGMAIGDALGMPTQSFPRALIRERYGFITGFLDGAPDQPIAPNMPAGSITDDTEQAIIVGQLLVEGSGHIEPRAFAAALLDWEQDMIRRGSNDLLGPSTKSALAALQAGASPEETGKSGTTDGAAMRIPPVGIAFAPGPRLMNAVVEACSVTHNTGLGISGAAAVAAAVSTGIAGGEVGEALEASERAAREGATRGHWVAGAQIAARYTFLAPQMRGMSSEGFSEWLYSVVGSSLASQEAVVCALLIADRFRDDPFVGLSCAASLGGDTDTIAAMAGAMLGAAHGVSGFPAQVVSAVLRVNSLDLDVLAQQLLTLRHSPAA